MKLLCLIQIYDNANKFLRMIQFRFSFKYPLISQVIHVPLNENCRHVDDDCLKRFLNLTDDEKMMAFAKLEIFETFKYHLISHQQILHICHALQNFASTLHSYSLIILMGFKLSF